MKQLDMFEARASLPAQSFGADGRRAYFWQDGYWQTGRAWEIRGDGAVVGMCRDYGPWGTTYAGRAPLETHGEWKPHEVCWKRPANQYERPQEPAA